MEQQAQDLMAAWQQGDLRPRPDPTELTRRSTEAAKDDLRREMDGIRHLVRQELDSRMALFLEKFAAVALEFRLREEWVKDHFDRLSQAQRHGAQESREAVAAALSAQKELGAAQNAYIDHALARIETTGQKQIEQAVALVQTGQTANDSKHNDLKDRVALIEGRREGIGTTWGVLIGVLGFLGMVVGIAVAIMKH